MAYYEENSKKNSNRVDGRGNLCQKKKGRKLIPQNLVPLVSSHVTIKSILSLIMEITILSGAKIEAIGVMQYKTVLIYKTYRTNFTNNRC